MNGPGARIWAFDFDGTLASLVADRHAAVIDPACEALLADLTRHPRQVVAVLSSRSLEDLQPRVRTPGVWLAGSSGLEWKVPGGRQTGPGPKTAERLRTERRRLIPMLKAIGHRHGVEIEDKHWSAAVHFRAVSSEDRPLLVSRLEQLRLEHGLSFDFGPHVAEVQFLPEVNKEMAVRTLVREFGGGLSAKDLLYAGDDENDAHAMRWVLAEHGTALIVGDRISLQGADRVAEPRALPLAIRHRFSWIRRGRPVHSRG